MPRRTTAKSSRSASEAGTPRGRSRWAFVREFLRSPRELGTAFPCSPAVARAMVRGIDTSGWRAVVELGAGTGALSGVISESLPEGCRFLAVERSPALAAEFRARWPDLDIVEGDAAEIGAICRSRRMPRVDAIFSALPLRLLPGSVQDRVLEGASQVLAPGGVFAQVTYWPRALAAGREMRERVAAKIGPVESDRLVAGNTPPAWVFRCVRPRG